MKVLNTNASGITAVAYFAILVWLFHGYSFGAGNHGAEIPPILAIKDPNIFPRDFAVQSFLEPGPRFFFYNMIAISSKVAGVGVDLLYLVIKIATHLSFFGALLSISNQVIKNVSPEPAERNKLTIILFGSLTIFSSINLYSWGIEIFSTSLIPSTVAMSVCIWSIPLAMRHKWIEAFALCGVAIFFQALVGFFAGLTLLPALIVLSIKKKEVWRPTLCSILLLLPMALIFAITNATNNSPLPNEFSFLKVFGEFRVPHHWLPSTGGWKKWLSDVLFLIAGGLALRVLYSSHERKVLHIANLLLGAIIVATAGIAANYIFVEVFPVELVGKLQFQRIMPFGHIAIWLSVSAAILLRWSKGNGLGLTGLTILSLCLPMLTAHYALPILRGSTFSFSRILLLTCFLAGVTLYITGTKKHRWILLIFASITLLFVNSEYARRVPFAGKVFASLYQALYDKEERGNEIYAWLYENTPIDTLVLIPPDWSTPANSLAFHSERSVYFSFKNVPYSDRGVFEWSRRAEFLLGQPITSEAVSIASLRSLWNERSPAEVVSIMDEVGACYLVDRSEDWVKLDLERIISTTIGSDEWSVWRAIDCAS